MPVVIFLRLLFLLPLLLVATAPGAEEACAMTKNQADAILDELRHIRQLLQRMERQPPGAPERVAKIPDRARTAAIGIAGRPILGDPGAPLTLVEFVDFQCPYCKRFAQATYPRLKADYVDTGRLRLVVKDLTLGFHGEARQAAQAAHCAGEQDRYWAMHDRLQGAGGRLDQARFLADAAALGLDRAAFAACIAADRHLQQIDGDAAEASKAGISGTPSFIIGPSDAERIEGHYIRGALPYSVFQKKIDELLAAAQ